MSADDMSASVIMGQFYLPSSSVLSSQPTSLYKLSRLQINKVRELYLSGKDAPLYFPAKVCESYLNEM